MVAQARKKPPVKTGPREKSIILTSMQAAVVDATLQGKDRVAACVAAGYVKPFLITCAP